jgi:predicted acyltransferase
MNRFLSLDVFRGATVALMILVNNPGSWEFVYRPLRHAEWHGCTPTDLVFPFFLFAVGNAMAFVMPKLSQSGIFWKKITRRFLVIFGIGLLLNWFPGIQWSNDEIRLKPLHDLRILGVLQRIALAYFFASIIIYFGKTRGAFFVGTVLLLVYWWLCYAFGTQGNPYSLEGYFGTAVDKSLLGESHMYHGEGVAFDPEGIISTIPAISSVIFGYLAGEYIIRKGKNTEMLSNLLIIAVILFTTSLAWSLVFPFNKKIWTSSYVLYSTSLALMFLGVLINLIELKGIRTWWTAFGEVLGKNHYLFTSLLAFG